MRFLVLSAYLELIIFDLYLARRSFEALYRKVRNCPVATKTGSPHVIEAVCSAVDVACVCYPKHVLCLQRSAATACLLKRNGVSAEMIIGSKQMPFQAHAWVEVAGRVVNDKPYVQEIYAVLDRC
jgi:hypothetical protein